MEALNELLALRAIAGATAFAVSRRSPACELITDA
jgi:hypothetical protein